MEQRADEEHGDGEVTEGEPIGAVCDPWIADVGQNSLSDLVFVEEMSNFKSPGCWSFLELCDAVRLLKCR
jgi:hypothetical protein